MTDYEAIKDKVDALLAEANIVYKVEFVGEGKDEPKPAKCSCPGDYSPKMEPWVHDMWRVTFTAQVGGASTKTKATMTTDYRTGIGHRQVPKIMETAEFPRFLKDTKGKPISAPPSKDPYHRKLQQKHAKPMPPRAADALSCLVSDAEALNTSFHYWCDELGYDRDSINALNTYNLCCENGEKIRKVFDHKTLAAVQELVREL